MTTGEITNLLHVILLLGLSLGNYLLLLSRKTLTERIDNLEVLLEKVTGDLDAQTPKD